MRYPFTRSTFRLHLCLHSRGSSGNSQSLQLLRSRSHPYGHSDTLFLANPLVYVVLCGRMTPTQKQIEIVKDRVRLDAEKVINLLEWFVRKSGHPGYKHVTPPTDCPQPTIIIDEDITNRTKMSRIYSLDPPSTSPVHTSHNQTRASMARNRNLSKPCLIGQCQRW